MCDRGGKDATEKAGKGQEARMLGVNTVKIVFDHAQGYCIYFLGITFFLFLDTSESNKHRFSAF